MQLAATAALAHRLGASIGAVCTSSLEIFITKNKKLRAACVWLDRATTRFRVFRPNSGYTGSFCVFGPVLSSPAHGSPSLPMAQI
jgi:hypothetical protein